VFFTASFVAFFATRFHRSLRISINSLFVRSSVPRRARTIASIAFRLCCLWRKVSRIRRLRRLRFTASLTFFFAIISPSRGADSVFGVARIRNCAWDDLIGGCSKTREKSLEFRSRPDFVRDRLMQGSEVVTPAT
jgi:hypothetical protein